MKYLAILMTLCMVSCVGVDLPSAEEVVDAIQGADSNEQDTDSIELEEDEEQTASGHNVDIYSFENGRSLSADFYGTFEKDDQWDDCGAFPQIVRLYVEDDELYFEDQRGHLVFVATLLPDYTFDITADVVDNFGRDHSEQICTCGYYSPQYYNDYIDCTCTIDYDFYTTSDKSCNLSYDML